MADEDYEHEDLYDLAQAKDECAQRARRTGGEYRVFQRTPDKFVEDEPPVYRSALNRADVIEAAREDGWFPLDFVAGPPVIDMR